MQRTTLLIELAGAHGVGKSTIAPMLAEKLRASLGAHQENGFSYIPHLAWHGVRFVKAASLQSWIRGFSVPHAFPAI